MNNALLVAMLAALCMCDCAAPPFEERYGKTGVSMKEWAEIRAAIRSITNSPVMLCTRVPEPKPAYQLDEITVSTADGKAYSARKIRGKWVFHEVILVGQTGPSSNQSLQPTATRCASTFFMIKQFQTFSAALPVAAAELRLVRPMKRVIPLVFVACAVAITSVISHDKAGEDGGPFAGAEIQLMRHAEAVYIFSVKTNSPEPPNQKDLRRLGPEARQALVDTLCNLDNWNWVTGGSEDCEPHDVGLLFQKSKDRFILRFCSVCDPRIGCGVDGTFRKSTEGWIKQQPWEAWKKRFAQLEARK